MRFFFFLWIFCLGLFVENFGQNLPADSTAAPADSTLLLPKQGAINAGGKDSVATVDSVAIDPAVGRSDFDAAVNYQATDSIVFDVNARKMYLYGKTKLDYKDIKMEAERTELDMEKSQLRAYGVEDTTGELTGTPVFMDKDQEYRAEEMTYNFKTKKGIIIRARTTQQGNFVHAEKTRKENDSTFYIANGKFTTCDHEHPHFYFKSKKMKVIAKDRIVSGPLNIVIADVPLPFYVPFAFFPFQKDRASGIILPTYGQAPNGFVFRNLGYYWATNPFMDMLFQGDVYTNGSFRAAVTTNYKLMYKFDGSLSLSYSRLITGEKEDGDLYNVSQDFFVKLTHRQTFSPTASLNANVEAGTASYLKRNSYDNSAVLRNTLQSSITLNKAFPQAGWRFTLGINHRQDLVRQTVSLELPSLAINRDRFFPFRRRKAVGRRRWYEDIGVQYNSNIVNRITVADSSLFTPAALKLFQNGMQHTVGVNTNIKVLKNISVVPSFGYREFWYIKSVNKTYYEKDTLTYNTDSVLVNKVLYGNENNYESGFKTARDFNFNLNASTNFYGIFILKKAKNGLAFRHTVQPNAAYTYRPDFGDDVWGYYRNVQNRPTGETVRYSRFENTVFGGPGSGEQQNVSFGLNNVLEMKYLPKTARGDTVSNKDYKKITLLDGFSLNMAYNFAADSLRWSDLAIAARNNILNGKVNFNFRGAFSPYAYYQDPENPKQGHIVNAFALERGQGVMRFTNASFAVGTSLQSKNKAANKTPQNPDKNKKTNPEKDKLRALYMDWNMPWTLAMNYTLNYSKPGLQPGVLTHSLNLTATLNLTPNWRINASSNFDFTAMKVGYTTLNIVRDLHCWEFSFQWTPFGQYKSYLFNIGVKSATLKDLKLTKQNRFQDRF